MKKIFASHLCSAFIMTVIPLYINAQVQTATYRVTQEIINKKPVNSMIYGNFIEIGFGRQAEGMWSEKLYNASFEEVIPYKPSMWSYLRRSPEDDIRQRPWWHSGYEEDQWYAYQADSKENPLLYRKYGGFYHGLQAVQLNNSLKKTKAYLAQDGIWINKGIACIFKGFMMNNREGDKPLKPVKVTIGLYLNKAFGNPISEMTVTVDGGVYKEYSVELNTGDFEGFATFAVSIEPGSNASFDGFSLMPVDNVDGWRKDVIDALKQIHVPIIRYPGGCFASFYNWRDGIGPRKDRRPVNSEYWGGLEENFTGTAEFLEMCNMVGSEPFICVNMMTGSPSEAAAWIRYCNSTDDDEMGKLRKEHGYEDPFRVKYWELDNETYRRWGYEEYARRCIEFSKYMKAADPSIQLVLVGYGSFNLNLREMLDIAGEHIDLVCDRATTEFALRKDLEIISEYNRKHGTNIRLCNTEWWAHINEGRGNLAKKILANPLDPDRVATHQVKVTWNYAMNIVNKLLMFQRLGGDFEFANFNNMCNTWGQNIIESPKERSFISAAGRIFELMSRSEAAWVHKTDTLKNIDGILIQAASSADNRKLILYALSYLDNEQKINVDLSAFKTDPKNCVIKRVYSDGPVAANKLNDPDRIKKEQETVNLRSSGKQIIVLKPWSVTEITINIR